MSKMVKTEETYIPDNQVNDESLAKDFVIQQRLKVLFDSTKIIHKTEILKEETLKYAHIYCKLNNLSGQAAGPAVECYIAHKYNMNKNSASECIGDLQHTGINYEIKCSFGGKDGNKFNFVQFRMNHNCEYILTAYYVDEHNYMELGELFVFRLNKNELKGIILKYGGYAHGTIHKLGQITQPDLDDISNDKEYAFRPKYGDKCWNELLQFRIDEFAI